MPTPGAPLMPQMTAAAPNASMRGSLVASVAELARIATSAEHLQAALSPFLRSGGEAADAAQSLDDITQHLHGLAEFLAAIASNCSPELVLDLRNAAAGLQLYSQKMRLTSGESAAATVAASLPRAFASGDLELW